MASDNGPDHVDENGNIWLNVLLITEFRQSRAGDRGFNASIFDGAQVPRGPKRGAKKGALKD